MKLSLGLLIILNLLFVSIYNPHGDSDNFSLDENLLGVNVGDTFEFISTSNSIFHYNDNKQNKQYYIPPNNEFNVTIKKLPEDRSPNIARPQYFISTEFEFNSSSHERTLSMHYSNSRYISIYYVLFTDWTYYDTVIRSEYDEITNYTTNHQFIIGKTESEFVVIETFDTSNAPVGTSSAIRTLSYEVRYDLETGVLNYIDADWSRERDYGPPFTVAGSTNLARVGYKYSKISYDNIKLVIPVSKENNEVKVDYFLYSLYSLIMIVSIIKASRKLRK